MTSPRPLRPNEVLHMVIGDLSSCDFFNLMLESVIRAAHQNRSGTIESKSMMLLAFADVIDIVGPKPRAVSATFCSLDKEANEVDLAVTEDKAQLTNFTVPQGRDVSFTCVVNNLGQYRVAWIKSDSKAILGIHTHMVSLNPRLSVTHNGHNTWKLHISHVQLNDSGSYMCQVNTDPMKSLSGYLDVVVPPDILNHPEQNLEEGISNEGGTIVLICSATGVPEPTVQWRREGAKDIVLRTETREKQVVKSVEGEKLVLTNVHRTDMGGYLCIASNGVPPSVSKRFDVHINFPPTIKAVNQLLGAPVEREVTLECIVEVYPKPLNGWYRNEGNLKLHSSNKYNISEAMINLYTWHLNLTIRHLTKADFGAYTCSSVNALGKSEARIRLQGMYVRFTHNYQHTTVAAVMLEATKNHTNRHRPALYPHRVRPGCSPMALRHKCTSALNDYSSLQIRLHCFTSHYPCSNLYRMSCPWSQSLQRHYGERMAEALASKCDDDGKIARKMLHMP
ncbi:lachesin [Rhagoletis pomonella]|uniref:lachesin n=1 Tax=Rhagoletis pomonella TaxID=28610 RepID=UPI00177C8342|nr:lachesin [Rhagoletis pomonella]